MVMCHAAGFAGREVAMGWGVSALGYPLHGRLGCLFGSSPASRSLSHAVAGGIPSARAAPRTVRCSRKASIRLSTCT